MVSGKAGTSEVVFPRRSRLNKPSDQPHTGRWKLVYADFVTVLLAFFIVSWILVVNLISKEKKLDRVCTNNIAELVRAQVDSDLATVRGKEPIQILSDYTVDGVRFTLVDSTSAMFQSGQAVISEFGKRHFDTIASAIKRCSGEHKLRIEGYTDGTKYAGGDMAYGNWELSTERANSARRELLMRGIEPGRISEVVGYGDSRPALPNDPNNALNRRVSITVVAPVLRYGRDASAPRRVGGDSQ
jgi:chemotaxis protein MotB